MSRLDVASTLDENYIGINATVLGWPEVQGDDLSLCTFCKLFSPKLSFFRWPYSPSTFALRPPSNRQKFSGHALQVKMSLEHFNNCTKIESS
jgi:hypothetical protein